MLAMGRVLSATAWLLAGLPAVGAETCFHGCLKPKLTSPNIDDAAIRALMRRCRDQCEDEAGKRLAERGIGIAACVPARLPDADVKRLRSASSSVIAYANAFSWDVKNVLSDRIIRRVEVTTQSLSLEDVTASGPVTVLPGETGTAVMTGVYDGYPSLRVTARIAGVFACPVRSAPTVPPSTGDR